MRSQSHVDALHNSPFPCIAMPVSGRAMPDSIDEQEGILSHSKFYSLLTISIIAIAAFLSIPVHAEPAPAGTDQIATGMVAVSKPVAETMTIPRSLLNRGLSLVGTRYRYGGTSPRNGVDCSGLMKIIYKKEGIALPHSARQQFKIGKPVNSGKLSPGDLVFFNTRGSVSHVGMYIGNGKFLHAANRKRGVRVDSLGSAYYNKRYIGARRILRTA